MADILCVEGGTSISLHKRQLQMILDTLYPVTGNRVPFTSLVTSNHGTSIYSSEVAPLAAYQQMLEGIGETDNIWTNYSPCPSCVGALVNHYNNRNGEKPTIHVARIYTESTGLTHVVKSLQCLARLIHEGFDIEAWNFNEFKAPAGIPAFVDSCTSIIDSYYGNGDFTSMYMELVTQVNFIQHLGKNPHAGSWCAP